MPDSPIEWSDWTPLALPEPLAPKVMAEVLDGGQSFRWNREPPDTWLGVWADCAVRLKPSAGGWVWSAPAPLASTVAIELPRYFAAGVDFGRMEDDLPWRSDAHLARCLEAFRGLRLLRQPLGEALLGFLCSATKQIVQIKQILALLAQRHGREIAPGMRRLPTWPELAALTDEQLRGCLLGFRARYIQQTAQLLGERPGWLEEVETLSYADAKQRLRELPGVGEKIADCVLLFGAGKYEAFPVDVWIVKALETRYGLDAWTPQQIARFGRVHFGPYAGLAQQHLFAWERAQGRGTAPPLTP
jgi:N-glycosylase/DNA lyase